MTSTRLFIRRKSICDTGGARCAGLVSYSPVVLLGPVRMYDSLRCRREGCPGLAADGHTYCSVVCKLLDSEFRRAESWAKNNPYNALGTEQWTTLVAAADAWSEYRAVRRAVSGFRCPVYPGRINVAQR